MKLDVPAKYQTSDDSWRIVLAIGAMTRLCQASLGHDEVFGIGVARQISSGCCQSLVVETIETVADLHSITLAPADFCVIVRVGLWLIDDRIFEERLQSIRAWGQAFAAVQMAMAGSWTGTIRQSVASFPLDELVIAGPRPMVLCRIAAGLPNDEPRFSRPTGVLGRNVMTQLRRLTVTQIGSGRLGTLMAWQWAALGIAHLRLIDGDDLAIENLDAMPGISARSVGHLKVLALGKELRRFRPDMRLTLLPKRVNSRAGSDLLFARTDLIVSTVDSDTARLAAAVIARESLTPHLDLATNIQPNSDGQPTLSGDIRLCLPTEGCCACVGGLADFREAVYELFSPEGAFPRRRRPVWNVERMGSLMSWNSTIAGAAVQSWLDLMAGRWTGSLWRRLAWDPQLGVRTDSARVTADPQCRVCQRLPLWTDAVK